VSINPDGPPAIGAVAELERHLPLDEKSQSLLPGSQTTGEYLQRLLDQGREVDAVRVLAYTLPVRRAVWWGLLCAWHAGNGRLEPARDRALAAAAQWVVEPSDARRKTADAAAKPVGLGDPAGCCAKAAAWAGAIPGPGKDFVPDTPLLTARVINGAVFLALAQRSETDPACTYRQLLDLGLRIGAGKLPWNIPRPKESR
jgi:Family of unknown function (DUF6931)